MDTRPSARHLVALRRLCTEFFTLGCPVETLRSADWLAPAVLRDLVDLGLARSTSNRAFPTRNGLRRASQLEMLARSAEVFRALQAAVRASPPTSQWLPPALAGLLDAPAPAVITAMYLLDAAPYLDMKFVGPHPPVLYVRNSDEFVRADARVLEAPELEPLQARTANALRLRYAEGLRHFPLVTIDGGDFAGANLDGICIERGRITGADFRGASLRGARLGEFPPRNVDGFYGFSLAECDLGRAQLHGADLRATELHGASLDGACFDGRSQIPVDALMTASWEVVYRNEEPRRRSDPWEPAAGPGDRGFRFSYDAVGDKWEVWLDGARVALLSHSIGLHVVAILAANPDRRLHALDLDALLTARPRGAGRIADLPYETGALAEILRGRGLPRGADLTDDEDHRLRACVRAIDKLAGGEAEELRGQVGEALKRRSLKLANLPRVKCISERVRAAYRRARDGELSASVYAPLIAATSVAEFCIHRPRPR